MRTKRSAKTKLELSSYDVDFLLETYKLKLTDYKKVEADWGLMFVRSGGIYIVAKKDNEIIDLLGPTKKLVYKTDVTVELTQKNLWKIKHEIFPLHIIQTTHNIIFDVRDIFKEYKEGTIK